MPLPPLVLYPTAAEYRTHFEQGYCRSVIATFDGIRVYFSIGHFEHCFYESSARNGLKDVFSPVRAQRIDWIKATLEHPQACLFAGWNKKERYVESTRRVAVVFEDFAVIVQMGLKLNGELRGNFVTCYQADNSITKIRASPVWTREACLAELQRKSR